MSENNITQEQHTEIPAARETAKKKIRVGFIFLAFVPAAVLMMIQTLTQTPFLILAVVETAKKSAAGVEFFDVYDEMLNIFNEKYAMYAYLLYAVFGLIVFTIWYYKGFVKKNPKVRIREIVSVRSITGSLCIVVGLFFFINAFMTLAQIIFPKAMEDYAAMVEASGLVSNAAITVTYAIFLGPVLEEFCFRGVTYGLLEKAGVKPGVAILISSVLFGAVHIILIQVIYATFFGMFLGFLRYKYRSIKISIATHILFNFTGTYISLLIEKYIPYGKALTLIFGGIAMFVLVFAIVLINSDKKAFKPAD